MDALFSFLLAALVLTGSPGPNTLSAAAVGASFGRLRGLEYVAGLSLGVGLVIVIVGTGVSGAVLAVPGLAPVITALAAFYFVYLAWRIATAPPLGTVAQHNPGRGPRWYAGVLLSLANPKAYAAMAALFSGHVLLPGRLLADGMLKAGLIMAVILTVNVLWLSTGAALARRLQSPRESRIVNVTFAALLLVSVAVVALG